MAPGGGAKKPKKKKSTTKRPGKNKKNSPLKKTNKRSSKQKMKRNKEKINASKQKMQQNKQQHAALMKKEASDFNRQSLAIKSDKSLSKEERRKKLTALQLQRRVREKEANQRLASQKETHSATKQKYRSAQERQMQQYRQRKRAVDFSDRQMQQRSSKTTTTTSASSVAQAQYIGGAPIYATGGGGYAPMYSGGGGFYAPTGEGGYPPQYGEAAQSVPPTQEESLPNELGNEEEEEENAEMRATRGRSLIPTRGVVVGVDEAEEDIELPDIPALSEVDPRMLRAFLLARIRFDKAVTVDDKIKYSTEFFEIAAKMDRMFHVHAELWHRIKKHRPPTWSVIDANMYADALPKETVEELARLSPEDLRNYLMTV